MSDAAALPIRSIGAIVERYMFDTIRISRRTEQGAYFDQSKGQTVYPAPTVIYEGKAYVAPMGIPTNSKYREEDVAQTTYEIAIPYNAAQVEPQDDGSYCFLSREFPNVYLRLDGTGITAPLPSGGGTVNAQYTNNGGLAEFIVTDV